MKTFNFLAGILLLFSMLLSCQVQNKCVTGEGDIVSKNFVLHNFDKITLSIPGNLYLTQSDKYSIKIDAQPNVLDNIDLKVDKNELIIDYIKCINNLNDNSLKIIITCPNLKAVENKNSGNVFFKNLWNVDKINLIVKGSGEINVNELIVKGNMENSLYGSGGIFVKSAKVSGIATNSISGSGDIDIENLSAISITNNLSGSGDLNVSNISSCDLMETKCSGSGDITLSSTAPISSCNFKLAGSGDINAFDLLANIVSVKIAGSGDIYVNALKTLNAKIAGSGDVYYKGDPFVIIDKVGSGDVINKNND